MPDNADPARRQDLPPNPVGPSTEVTAAPAGGPPAEPPEDWAASMARRLAEDLARCWRAGRPLPAEAVLADVPELLDHPGACVVVLAEEIRQHCAAGRRPTLEE